MRRKHFQSKGTLTEEGSLEAVFSVFDVVDSDGDVVLPTAIQNGKSIPLVWSHDWSRPIGKGTIVNDGKKAIFKGQFNLNTSWGRDAYESVKDMGDLQEYSWGFRIETQEKGEKDGKVVNYIKETEEFEVSPVLIGANRETYTVDVKAHSVRNGTIHEEKFWADVSADGSFENLKDELNRAFRDRQFSDSLSMGWTEIVATYDDRFIALMWSWNDEEDSYWEVSYSRNDSGELLLGEPKQVTPEIEFAPVGMSPKGTQGISYDQHSDIVRIAVSGLLQRSKTGSELRRKEGRAISAARRTALETVVTWLTDASKQIQDLLDETASTSTTTEDDSDSSGEKSGLALFAEFQRIEAGLNGVAV